MQSKTPEWVVPPERCLECGVRTPQGQPTCPEMHNVVQARELENPAQYWRERRLRVDAYCLQHSAYVESAKSLAAHLCGICIAFEYGNDPAALQRLQRWLSTNPPIVKPAVPAFRGILTVGHVYAVEDSVEYGRGVEEWARSVWGAYRHLQ